tara:strand:- start:1482 stop:1670 length:189 start_codon:yes stop_codon:yes gene_type:complete
MTPRVEGTHYNQCRWKKSLEGPDNGLWRVWLHGRVKYRGTMGECLEWREMQPEKPYAIIQGG